MPVTTNTRKLAALLGASGGGIHTDGTLQTAAIKDGAVTAAKVAADMATQAELDAIPQFDDTEVRHDISALALRQAIGDNHVAYNLPNSFIDQFQDSSGLGTLTTVTRDATEYISSSSYEWANSTSSNWSGGSATHSGANIAGNANDDAIKSDVTFSGDFTVEYTSAHTSGSNQAAFGVYLTSLDGSFNANSSTGGMSGMASSWWNSDSASGNGSAMYGSAEHQNHSQSIEIGETISISRSGAVFTITSDEEAYGGDNEFVWGSSAQSTATVRIAIAWGAPYSSLGWNSVRWKGHTLTTNATGTLIGTANVPSAAQTKVSGVILYKDASGTATIGTDLKIYFTCNGGTNWTEAASYTTVTPVFSTGIKMVNLGETTCTSGSDVRYKAVWANQAGGSKVTQLHGIGLNY